MVRFPRGASVRMSFSAVRVASGQGLRVPALVGLGFIIEDQKAEGVAGGTSVAGENIRALNVETVNTIAGAVLGVNKFTLTTGTYEIKAKAPLLAGAFNRLALRNITDSGFALQLEDGSGNLQLEDGSGNLQLEDVVEVVGHSEFSNIPAFSSGGNAWLFGRFTVSGTKVFELIHYIDLAGGSSGLGADISDGSNAEIYATVHIFQV